MPPSNYFWNLIAGEITLIFFGLLIFFNEQCSPIDTPNSVTGADTKALTRGLVLSSDFCQTSVVSFEHSLGFFPSAASLFFIVVIPYPRYALVRIRSGGRSKQGVFKISTTWKSDVIERACQRSFFLIQNIRWYLILYYSGKGSIQFISLRLFSWIALSSSCDLVCVVSVRFLAVIGRVGGWGNQNQAVLPKCRKGLMNALF